MNNQTRLPSGSQHSKWNESPGFVQPTDAQRVMRNTYLLLALSMIPTVIGAWFGVTTGIVSSLGVGVSLVVFLVGAFGLMFLIGKNRDSGLGVGLLMVFTAFMGVMLSPLLGSILGKSNGVDLVMTAFAGTAGIMAAMAILSTFIKRDISGMGKFLMVGVVLLIIAMVINIFMQSSAMMITLSVLAIGIFSAFLLYDLKRIIDGGETNYVMATLSIYLSLFNIFQNLLALLGIWGSND